MTEETSNVVYLNEEVNLEEQYRLALESVFRWTLRRDELNDSQIVLAIKRVAKHALKEV